MCAVYLRINLLPADPYLSVCISLCGCVCANLRAPTGRKEKRILNFIDPVCFFLSRFVCFMFPHGAAVWVCLLIKLCIWYVSLGLEIKVWGYWWKLPVPTCFEVLDWVEVFVACCFTSSPCLEPSADIVLGSRDSSEAECWTHDCNVSGSSPWGAAG